MDVLYTAFDGAGNWAQCLVQIRIPDTKPPVMKCPDSFSIDRNTPTEQVHVVFNKTTMPIAVQDVSNITEVCKL
jgi:hypothetical protein